MCLIALAWKTHPDYPLVLAANRDEFFTRPAAPLQEWPEHPGLYAGRDLQAGGTWLGVHQPSGRFAALTNVRRLPAPEKNGPSRGRLVLEVLLQDAPLEEILQKLQAEKHLYQGFNLLAGDSHGLFCLSSHTEGVEPLEAGVHALSNATLNEPWPKVVQARDDVRHWIRSPGAVSDLALLLHDRTPAPPSALPATGLSPEWEEALSAQFIHLPDYGTRACTGLMISARGELALHEQTFDAHGQAGAASTVRFSAPGW